MSASRTIAVVNPKGGSGKTTNAVHLAVAAHREGHDTVLLDTDAQGSAIDWDRRTPEDYDGPDVEGVGRSRTLAAAIGQVDSEFILIDSSAQFDEMTGRVLSNADLALVPVRPSGVDLWGTAEFLDLLNDHIDQGLVAAFVGSQRDVRTTLAQELDAALSRLGLPLLNGLTLRVSYVRSMSEGRTVLDGYDTTAANEVWTLFSDTLVLLP